MDIGSNQWQLLELSNLQGSKLAFHRVGLLLAMNPLGSWRCHDGILGFESQ